MAGAGAGAEAEARAGARTGAGEGAGAGSGTGAGAGWGQARSRASGQGRAREEEGGADSALIFEAQGDKGPYGGGCLAALAGAPGIQGSSLYPLLTGPSAVLRIETK